MSDPRSSKELAKQLRDNAAVLLAPETAIPFAAIAGALQTAADEIERLNGEITDLLGLLETRGRIIDKLRASNEPCRDDHQSDYTAALREIAEGAPGSWAAQIASDALSLPPAPARYEIQTIREPLDDSVAYRVTDIATDSRVATCYVESNARLVCDALNRAALPPGDDEPPVMGGALHPIPPPPSGVERIEWHVRQIEIICDALNLDPTEWLMPDLEALDGGDVPASSETKGEARD